MRLGGALSGYLDALRFLAAFTVVLGHLRESGYALTWLPLSFLSHESVVVFFVLSGLIIHATTPREGASFRRYVIARSTRVYSVAVPAILFCTGLAWVLNQTSPELVPSLDFYRPASAADMLGSLLFINESWSSVAGIGTRLSMNGPYWSLCYEVWYYVLFGLFVFAPKTWRWPCLLLATSIAGPAIVLLLPIWCMGAWLSSRWDSLPRLKPGLAWALFLSTPALAMLVAYSGLDMGIKDALHAQVPGYWRLEYSQRFVTDNLLGVLVVAHLYAYGQLQGPVPRWFEQHRARWAAWAGFSFTLYLFHKPLLAWLTAVAPASLRGPVASLLVAALLTAACWALSWATERQLPRWRHAAQAWWPERRI
jgi:peptidoglycan/LPS O-acetylase OafA/YrhL